MTRKRKYRPVSVERDAALIKAGLDPNNVQWDHNPPLAMRSYDEDTGLYDPDENDPRFLVPMSKKDHAAKTHGKNHDVSDGDIHKIAKVKRLRKKLLVKLKPNAFEAGYAKPKPKRKLQSRPFPKKRSGI